MNIQEIWKQIEENLGKTTPTVLNTLRKAATLNDISKLEETLGKKIPDDFKEYLLVHDGQDDPSRLQILCEDGILLSVNEIIETWNMLNEINESIGPGSTEWWNRKYLPFTNFEGDNACIDLENGEIVFHIHDSEIERGIAKNFSAWFYEKLLVFKEGRFKVDDGYLEFWNINS